MKTLLVLAPEAGFADAVRAVVDPQRFRVVYYRDTWAAEPVLTQTTIDGCILDCDLTSIQPIRAIEALRKRLGQCPILVYAGTKQWEWEEEAYQQGVLQILSKPIRARMLALQLERAFPVVTAAVARTTAPRAATVTNTPATTAHRHSPVETLGVLRDFSAILSHSLQAEPLLKEFLLLLREIIGVNRAAIFLRQPQGVLSDPGSREAGRRLRASCAIGLPPGLMGQFDLSLDAGIGGYIFRNGRVLRREAPEVEADLEMQKEFELLGAQVAVPILDRENLLGVALFDGRVTGEPIVNGELGLIFHLLEELGMAIKNIWLHDQSMASHDMMTDILRQLHSACLVVGWDLQVLHSNDAARQFFARPERKDMPLDFTDLPQILGSRVFHVLKSGQEVRNFKYTGGPGQKNFFRVTITPFRKNGSTVPSAALVLVEDCTDEERVHSLEIETANLSLVRKMAERLAHEVGNAIVPLSTHQQLFVEKQGDPEFRDSLKVALDDGVRRVSRLANQMLFLTRDLPARLENISLPQLIQDAFNDAQRHQPDSKPVLLYENNVQSLSLEGDRASLRHALYELLLNAVQASAKNPKINVRSSSRADDSGQQWVDIEIKDSGPGFTPEAAEHAGQPFYTTRNVGLGIGLTVCRKIIEVHKGRLEVEQPEKAKPGFVRVSLPVSCNGLSPIGNGKH